MSFSSWSLGVLVLVAIAIPLVMNSLRRAPSRQAGPWRLEVLSQLSVGTRERVMLVRAADRVLLLGVTGQQISLLNQLDGLPAELLTQTPPPATGFAHLLRDTLASYTGRQP